MARCYPKEHDILKICGKFKGKRVHYCPHSIGIVDSDLFTKLKIRECYRSLQHHCVFRSYSKNHVCNSNELFPITREDFFLALADVKASVISRKLNVGYRKTKASTWDVTAKAGAAKPNNVKPAISQTKIFFFIHFS